MNISNIKLKSPLFIFLILLLVVGLTAVVFIPKSNWKNIFHVNKVASAYYSGDFGYDLINGDTEAQITEYTGAGGDVIIPDTLDGFPVTSIGSSVFLNNIDLTGVTIPNTVTYIGDYAFMGTGLNSVIIPDSVTSVGFRVFHNCQGLSSVTIGGGLISIGAQMFADDSSLTSINIPGSVSTIGSKAFAGSGLTSVSIGNGVSNIVDYAFSGVTGLTSLVIPNSVTIIGGRAFEYCSGLSSVTIGSGITRIGGQAFQYCDLLSEVYFMGNAPTTMYSNVFQYSAVPFKIRYLVEKTGWTNPWYGYTTEPFLLPAKDITDFGFSVGNPGTITGTDIIVSVPFGTNISSLVAIFTASTGASVKVGSDVQTSGVTTNDFTNPIVYTVIASDSSTQNYTVTVNVLSSTKTSYRRRPADTTSGIGGSTEPEVAEISVSTSSISALGVEEVTESTSTQILENTLSNSAPAIESTTTVRVFNRNLALYSVGDDVKLLQEYLNNKGFIISATGPGSIGNETTFFGPKTKEALIKYQEYYKDQILKPFNLSQGTGFFGRVTREHVNNN